MDDKLRIDAKEFQEPLWKLAEAMAELVIREGHKQLPAAYISQDIQFMIRHAIATYNLLFYLNADERREQDTSWNYAYGVAAAPLVRTLIDCLYNIITILENPAENGAAYHKSGLRKRLLDIEANQEQYSGKAEWDNYNARQIAALRFLIHEDKFTEDDVRTVDTWKPMGTYILQGKKEDATAHQSFLKRFTYLRWKQYSGLSHASLDGYIGELPAGSYFVMDRMAREDRENTEKMYVAFLTRHLGRSAIVLLCIVTELQLYFRFKGHQIDERILKMWDAMIGIFEVKEIYDERYEAFLRRDETAKTVDGSRFLQEKSYDGNM
jgi:hypothetical protein